MQCYSRGSRQYCIIKNPVQYCLNTLGTTRISEKLQTILHKKKTVCNFVLILLRQHCTGQNPMQCCPRGSRQHCIRKNPVECCLNTLGTRLHKKKSLLLYIYIYHIGYISSIYQVYIRYISLSIYTTVGHSVFVHLYIYHIGSLCFYRHIYIRYTHVITSTIL